MFFAVALASLAILFALDQHRFQPWAYELALLCIVALTHSRNLDKRNAVKLMRWLLISIYLYSAIGKLDFEFLHTVGQQMLAVVMKFFNVNAGLLSSPAKLALVASFPLLELAIAMGLMFRPTRAISAWLAIALHLGLILILGPLGLNHRFGVLVWNLQVAGQVFILFLLPASKPQTESVESEQAVAPESEEHSKEPRQQSRISALQAVGWSALAIAIVMPATERFGFWDHWPSWALYAPHSSRVFLEIAAPDVSKLPDSLQSLIEPESEETITIWKPVPLDAWSLATLQTPIYPQARFQIGVAEAIIRKAPSEPRFRITVLGTASRFSGVRQQKTIDGLPQLAKLENRFWLNFHPRKH